MTTATRPSVAGRALAALSVVLLLGGLAAGPRAQHVSTECMDCHDDMASVIAAPVEHLPAAQGACTECHAPHAARFPKLLKARERALCFECHTEQSTAFMTRFVHTPVKEGSCTSCHEVHGGQHAGLLVQEGSELCFGCHEELAARADWTTPHAPFAMGECGLCHDPHASDHRSQLLAEPAVGCAVCHEVDDAELLRSHGGIPVAGTRCDDCHEPHASDTGALLLPVSHSPFDLGLCDACHLVDSATPQVLAATGGRLCAECHDEYPRKGDDVVHAPVAQGACLSCHSPHASRHEGLLLDASTGGCLECHAELATRAAEARSSHPVRAADGGCLACHQPHSSTQEHLLSAGELRTCLGCHEMQRHGHPLGSDRIDPRTGKGITCVTCHDPHGTEFPMQLRGDQSRGLCIECHASDHDGRATPRR